MRKYLILTILLTSFASAQQRGRNRNAPPPPPPPKLDLSNGIDAVKALQKIACSLEEGKSALYYWEGNAYSRVPGERDKLLFSVKGMNIRACKNITDENGNYGYRQVTREAMIYLDPRSGEILKTWKNPWTTKDNEVLHVLNDPVNQRPIMSSFTLPNGTKQPFDLGATFINGKGMLSFEVPLFYTNPLGGDYQDNIGGTYQALEAFNFLFNEAELLDATQNEAPNVQISWARSSRWLPWMEMGDRVGYMFFNAAGLKLKEFSDLPDDLENFLKTDYPEYQNPPPLDDARPNETSWTYFKKKKPKTN